MTGPAPESAGSPKVDKQTELLEAARDLLDYLGFINPVHPTHWRLIKAVEALNQGNPLPQLPDMLAEPFEAAWALIKEAMAAREAIGPDDIREAVLAANEAAWHEIEGSALPFGSRVLFANRDRSAMIAKLAERKPDGAYWWRPVSDFAVRPQQRKLWQEETS